MSQTWNFPGGAVTWPYRKGRMLLRNRRISMTRRTRAAQKLGAQLAEIGAAVPSVIGRRMTHMAFAGANPAPSDEREIALMSSEKIDAARESWNAMTTHALALNATVIQNSMAFWMPWVFAAKPLPVGTEAFMALASAGLRPYQRIVKANDKRLRKQAASKPSTR
jgi:hypothetical protein